MRRTRHRRPGRLEALIERLEPRWLLAAISSDQSITGSVGTPAEVDEYTFSASAGDAIIAVLGETDTTTLDPAITLVGPGGNTIVTDIGTVGTDIFATLTQAGTYTLRVSDNGANGTGNYRLTFAKLPGAQSPDDGDGGSIGSGQRKEGTLPVGDLDVYTFTGAAGDSAVLMLADAADGGYDPQLFVYGPTGTQLATDIGEVGTDVFLDLTTAGTYYVVVRDWIQEASPGFSDADIDAGAYVLRMAKLPGNQVQDDADGGPITSGQRKDGRAERGDLDVYTFTGAAGDNVILTLAERGTDTAFDPELLVYGPGGTLVTSDIGLLGTDAFVSVATAGTYYVVVRDRVSEANLGFFDSGVDAGDYALRMIKAPGAQAQDDEDGGAIDSGQRKEGRIDRGDMDAYSFTGAAGDNVILTLVERGTDTAFDPQIFVYDPAGDLVTSDIGQLGTDALVSVATAGTYYVVVRDRVGEANPGFYDGEIEAGDYALRMFKAPGAQVQDDPDGGPMTSGQRKDGSIGRGDLDAWTFTGAAGDTVIITLIERNRDKPFAPEMLVYGPNGALVTSDFGNIGTDTSVNITAAGTYHVVVRDRVSEANPGFYDAGIDDGEYTLRLVKLPGVVTHDDADGGPLVSGQLTSGMLDLGDLDVYTLVVDTGDSILVNAGRPGLGGHEVQTRLFSPTGALLDTSNGTSDLVVFANAVSTSGTYYVLVNDVVAEANPGFPDGDIEAGEYVITAAVTPGAQPVDADSGPLSSGGRRAGALTAGDIDVFTFTAAAGVPFTLNLTDTAASAFSPWLRLYSPTGALVFNQANANSLAATVASPVAGTYTAMVLDDNGADNGSYAIGLNTAAGADDFLPTVLAAEYRYEVPELRVIFSEDVGASFAAGDIVVTNVKTGQVVDNALFAIDYNAARNLFVVTFPAFEGRVLPDGDYRLHVTRTSVDDAADNPLEADLDYLFFVLAGDADRDHDVDGNDAATWALNFTGELNGGPTATKTWGQGDWDYDGDVDGNDIAKWGVNFTGALGGGALSVGGAAAASGTPALARADAAPRPAPAEAAPRSPRPVAAVERALPRFDARPAPRPRALWPLSTVFSKARVSLLDMDAPVLA